MRPDSPWFRSFRPSPRFVATVLTVAAALAQGGPISGDLLQWHKVTLTVEGPQAAETDTRPNPFRDYRFTVEFAHESGAPRYVVPGYFAADGNAAESGAVSGNKWRAHLSPDKTGTWTYRVSFVSGLGSALSDAPGTPVRPVDGLAGTFKVRRGDGRDPRSRGRLMYANDRYLHFAGTRDYFLKAGPDSPEALLACADFDGTHPGAANPEQVRRRGEAARAPLKTWGPHARDWHDGDPSWRGGKGKGLIGALNYLASKGVNAFSFLTYNAGGDGDNVWPFAAREDKLHYDCSKLDQWGMVFDHATSRGLFLHFKMQETEIDDERRGDRSEPGRVPEALDGGRLGPERMLYCRELIARFSHNLALNWNLGEENTQSSEEIRDMARYIRETDPYDHLIVVHTYPGHQDRVYTPLLGDRSDLTGVSLQNAWNEAHRRTLKWIEESRRAGKPWVVANDEQNPASLGVPPDPGFEGSDGKAREGSSPAYDLHDIRRNTLWGTLMAGGAGVEYYFGYTLPQNDLQCEDWRSRDLSWNYCRIALEFFRLNRVPLPLMENADALIGNPNHENSGYCLAQAGELYLVYLPFGTRSGKPELDLSAAKGTFEVRWYNPRSGGKLLTGDVRRVKSGCKVSLGAPPEDSEEDWLAVVRR